MVFEFDTSMDSNGFMEIILILENTAGQLAPDNIRRVVAQVSSRKNQLA